jgi:methylmalonyl-CoA mutase C-terminal domain/subunit
MEVVFIRYPDAEGVMNTALQEDVDAICLSFLSGGHSYDVPLIMRLLKEKKMDHIAVIIGGLVPPKDVAELLKLGVRDYYGPGSDLDKLIDYLRGEVAQ